MMHMIDVIYCVLSRVRVVSLPLPIEGLWCVFVLWLWTCVLVMQSAECHDVIVKSTRTQNIVFLL